MCSVCVIGEGERPIRQAGMRATQKRLVRLTFLALMGLWQTVTGNSCLHGLLAAHNVTAGSCCSEAAFQNLHHLERLQSLVLGWAQLPRPVIAGCEAWCLTGTTLDSTTMPGLSKLTALRKLVVAGSVEAVDPVLLAGLPAALQHLQLDDVRLVMTLGQVSVCACTQTQTTVSSPAMPAVSASQTTVTSPLAIINACGSVSCTLTLSGRFAPVQISACMPAVCLF